MGCVENNFIGNSVHFHFNSVSLFSKAVDLYGSHESDESLSELDT